MVSAVQCPDCGTMMTEAARFCPGCGRPRTHVEQFLRQVSARTGTSYEVLLEQARSGELVVPVDRWQEPLEQPEDGSTGVDLALALIAAAILILVVIGGGTPVALVFLIGLVIALFVTSRSRIARAEQRTQRLAARLLAVETELRSRAVIDRRAVPSVPETEPVPPVADVVRPAPPRHVEPGETLVPTAPVLEPPAQAPEYPRPPWSAEAYRETQRGWSTADLEELLSGRVLALVGGLAIIVGAIFFLSLAFSRDWIGPGGRVLIGVVASVVMLGGGAWLFERRERILGHVLLAVGLSVMSLSLFAATNFYDLIAIEVGLAGAMASAAVAAVVAIRARSQVVAAYGLVAVLAAPPVLGASASLSTIGFVAVALVATAAISLYHTWRWLPLGAFVLTAPQLGDWLVSDAPVAWGLVALGGFWVINAVAAGGEEFRVQSNRLRASSATLLAANAVYAVWAGFVVLDGDLEAWRGLFLAVLGLAHVALAAFFLLREVETHPFGLLAAGSGIAALSVAVPVQLGGPVVPMIWAAEAAALAWVYARRNHLFSAGAAVALGVASVLHLALFEYPFEDVGMGTTTIRPFLNASGGTLLFILGAIAVSGVFVRRREVRALLAGAALLLLFYSMPFEVTGAALLAGWAAIFVAGFALHQRWDLLPEAITGDEGLTATEVRLAVLLPALLAGFAALLRAMATEMPLEDITTWARPDTPFTSSQTLAAIVLIATALLASLAASAPVSRRSAIAAALLIAGYLMPFELGRAATVLAWSLLALGALALANRARTAEGFSGVAPYLIAAASLFGIGLLVTIVSVAPPERLAVRAGADVDHPLLWSGATVALLALATVAGLAAWLLREWKHARWLAVASGVLIVYLLSVGVVDSFQTRIDSAGLESLQKQAQVALSILWAALGVAALITGFFKGGATLRIGGLALLGLSTAKVFIYDLSSLDTAYRVLSFIGLGILLLASSYAYQRMMPSRSGRGET